MKIKNQKQKNLFEKIKKADLDAFFTADSQNIKYLTDFASQDGVLLVTKEEMYFFTSSCELEEAKAHLASGKVLQRRRGEWLFLKEFMAKKRIRRLGFEEHHLSLAGFKTLKKNITKCRLKGTDGFIEELRVVKSADEVARIKEAITITENIILKIKRYFKTGCSEKDILKRLLEFIARSGVKPAFNPIVAFNSHTAIPHAEAGERRLKRGDLVLIDIGVDFKGYKSDLTRTFVFGKLNPRQEKIYNLVLRAQNHMSQWIKPGMSIMTVEKEAHDYFKASGLADYFSHSVGHGIGLEVHERPFFSLKNKGKLIPGMVFVLEPALYLPGWGGIRIEDDFQLTEKGCRKLSSISVKPLIN